MSLQLEPISRIDRQTSESRGAEPLRVLLVSHTCYSRNKGQPKAHYLAQYCGINLKVLTLQKWWEDDGVWYDAEEPLPDAGFDLVRGPARWPYHRKLQRYLHYYPRVGRLLREFRPEVIDIWEEPWGLASAHICRMRNKVLPSARIISETEQNINKNLPVPFAGFRRYSLRNADFVVARNSEAIEVTRMHGFTGPVQVVGNAVETDLFRPLDKAVCRAKFGINGFTIGYIGRLVEEKGLTEMLDALAHCSAEVNVLFVGNGPMKDALEAKAAAMGKTSQVHFLPARCITELPEVMNALDALVLASRTTPKWKEQFGRVIIEAHACEVPVIGSSSGAIPEVVGDGGLVFPEGDVKALAAAIEQIRTQPGLARRMGTSGRQMVEDKYTWRKVAEQMGDIYRRVAGRDRV